MFVFLTALVGRKKITFGFQGFGIFSDQGRYFSLNNVTHLCQFYTTKDLTYNRFIEDFQLHYMADMYNFIVAV